MLVYVGTERFHMDASSKQELLSQIVYGWGWLKRGTIVSVSDGVHNWASIL